MKSAKIALALVAFVAAATMAARAQTSVFVPGNTNGGFGNPIDTVVPLVPAITVSEPSRITITYLSGTVTDAAGIDTGPTGTDWNQNGAQSPLQEAKGVSGGTIHNLDALIGVFVPARKVSAWKFRPVDGTKDVVKIGIMSNTLFFVGTGRTFRVSEAGTLYLGINDYFVGDNGGGFSVIVSVQ
jgi:hypothetical protein